MVGLRMALGDWVDVVHGWQVEVAVWSLDWFGTRDVHAVERVEGAQVRQEAADFQKAVVGGGSASVVREEDGQTRPNLVAGMNQ